MTEEKMRRLLEEARERLDWDSQAEDLCARIDAAITKQDAGSSAAAAAPLPSTAGSPSATQVVSEALCRNNWSGFGAVCAGVCEACTIPSQPHPCEHAVTVWGGDAQEILAALKQEGLVAGAEQALIPNSAVPPARR